MKNHRLPLLPVRLLPVFLTTALLTILCGGCGGPEASAPVPARETVSEIDTKIKEIQADPNIPAQAKPKVLASLQKEREEAAKTESATTQAPAK